jgi:hypothetical protein
VIEWLKKRPLPFRILVYAAAVTVAFVIAAGVGAVVALMLRGGLGLPGTEEPQRLDEQQNAPRTQQRESAAQQEGTTSSQRREAEYVARVGEIQANSVEAFLDSHERLLHYDALTADDVEEMQANQDALQKFSEQASGLDPPQKYREHYEVFRSAINELYEAARLAYTLAADPTAATQSRFDEYDSHVDKAAAGLQRSNEILGRDYKTIKGVQRVSPLS